MQAWVQNPLTDLPLHHPFVELQSLQRVAKSKRVSLIGVVSTQPGLVSRETKFGSGEVCNAVIRQGKHLVRCGSWRSHGHSLARHSVGTALALHQVNVYHKNGGWEVAATEATHIEECPEELRTELIETTDLGSTGITLTQTPNIDYNVVKTKPATLSGLASVILHRQARDLEGVFEVHSIAVLGVSSVLSDGGFKMRSCAKCKSLVRADLDQCEYCTEFDGFEHRWILSLDMADQRGACSAMLYHDAAKEIPFLVGSGDDDNDRLKISKSFRSKLWSVRIVYKRNDLKATNYLEIKKIEPTLTAEGVVASLRLLPAPHVSSQSACPFARCSEVSFDRDLGVLTVNGAAVHAARLLVVVLAPADGEIVATPDVTNSGFRVCRKVKCALSEQHDVTYEIRIAGIAGSVQWLMTAAADACFLITAQGRGADKAFTVLAYEDTKAIGEKQYRELLHRHVTHAGDVSVNHASTDTPKKRLEALNAAVPDASTPQPFNKRQKLN